TDTHARAQGNSQRGQRIALQGRKGSARVGNRVNANAKPGHAVRPQDAKNGRHQNNHHRTRRHVLEHSEVKNHARGNQDPQNGQKFALLKQIGLAGPPNYVRDARHAFVHRQRFGLLVLVQAEYRPDTAHQDAEVHESDAADAVQYLKRDLGQVRDAYVRFARVRADRSQQRHHQADLPKPTFIVFHTSSSPPIWQIPPPYSQLFFWGKLRISCSAEISLGYKLIKLIRRPRAPAGREVRCPPGSVSTLQGVGDMRTRWSMTTDHAESFRHPEY